MNFKNKVWEIISQNSAITDFAYQIEQALKEAYTDGFEDGKRVKA